MAVLSKKKKKKFPTSQNAFLSKRWRTLRCGKHGKISVMFSSNFGNKIKRSRRDTAPAFRSISVWHCFMRRTAVVCCWQGNVWKVTGHITCVSVHSSVNLYAIPFSAQEESLLTRNYVTRWNKGMRSKQTLGSLEDFHWQNVSLCVQSTSEAKATSSTVELTVKQTPVEKQSLCTVRLHFFVMFISWWQTPFILIPLGFHDLSALTQPARLLLFTSGHRSCTDTTGNYRLPWLGCSARVCSRSEGSIISLGLLPE